MIVKARHAMGTKILSLQQNGKEKSYRQRLQLAETRDQCISAEFLLCEEFP